MLLRRPGRRHGDPEVEIPVAEGPRDRAGRTGAGKRTSPSTPGSIPWRTQNIEKAADREWVWTVYEPDVLEYRERHDELNQPLVDAAFVLRRD